MLEMRCLDLNSGYIRVTICKYSSSYTLRICMYCCMHLIPQFRKLSLVKLMKEDLRKMLTRQNCTKNSTISNSTKNQVV